MTHNFHDSLAMSHRYADSPIWAELYAQAFPGGVMCDHRKDGDHQRAGVDRSITMPNAKQYLIDEKYRGRNKKTGKVYLDILLEYLSDVDRGVLGWVVKQLLCDFIAYAIGPVGKGYLLPVLPLQNAWARHSQRWISAYPMINALNEDRGRRWVTRSVAVPPQVLFPAIGSELRFELTPWEESPPQPSSLSPEAAAWVADYEAEEQRMRDPHYWDAPKKLPQGEPK